MITNESRLILLFIKIESNYNYRNIVNVFSLYIQEPCSIKATHLLGVSALN